MSARGDARKRLAEEAAASPISMHSDAHNGLTEAEREELLSAMCAPDPDRAPVTEVQMLYLTSTVARIKAEAVQAERERIATEIGALREQVLHRPPDDFDRGWTGAIEEALRIARSEGR